MNGNETITIDEIEYDSFVNIDMLEVDLDLYMTYFNFYKDLNIRKELYNRIIKLKEDKIFTDIQLLKYEKTLDSLKKEHYLNTNEDLAIDVRMFKRLCERILSTYETYAPQKLYSEVSFVLNHEYARAHITDFIDILKECIQRDIRNQDSHYAAFYLSKSMEYLKNKGISADTSQQNFENILKKGIEENDDFCLFSRYHKLRDKKRALECSYGCIVFQLSDLKSGYYGISFDQQWHKDSIKVLNENLLKLKNHAKKELLKKRRINLR